MGMAKPIASVLVRTIVLMPITSPTSLTNGPPLLPELSAASVWMYVPFRLTAPTSKADRLGDETIPNVTVKSSPTGQPTAITQSPDASLDESPMGAVGNDDSPTSAFNTARSVSSSNATTTALNVRPLLNVTVNDRAP